MSAEAERSRLNNNQRQKLHKRIADIAPLLDVESPFTVRDVDADVIETVKYLRKNGAVRKVGKVVLTKDRDYRDWPDRDVINQWEWNDGAREHLQNYFDRLTTFPNCNHRAHICNPREVDGFSCRKCIDDGEYPEYSREQLEELGVV